MIAVNKFSYEYIIIKYKIFLKYASSLHHISACQTWRTVNKCDIKSEEFL